jgi:uncharacterized protein YyaL (SSP411 family)
MPNHLSSEKSPYLLQHALNPVDWYPWGEAAFEKAREQSKPIFLSVGYATCHWCHVMAHESFESPAVAAVLNEHFVPVKVDREERPDIDHLYMTFVQAVTGSGGWPMNVWLTPALEPFYGGTYFPPTARWGRPGLLDLLTEIARVWREDPEKVLRSAAQLLEQLRRVHSRPAGHVRLDARVLESAVSEFSAAFDRRHAGFGAAPKFPRPSEMLFLLREFARTLDTEARDMALGTLRAMARGGIHDHLGGGFHRYSVDALWRVPHFEKMLYDQAQLVLAYLEAYQVSRDGEFADVAAATLDYMVRDLGRPGGGFFSAQDADSTPPHQAGDVGHSTEGAFYLWTDAEIGEVLGQDAGLARLRFGVHPSGNAVSDLQGASDGKNVLYQARTLEEIAASLGQPQAGVVSGIADARRRLFEIRSRRPRPGLDDKILTAWNGLAIAAFARAARVLDRSWLEPARDTALFIHDHLWNAQQARLLRRYRDGDAGIDAYASDYAYLVFGLLELFQAGGEPRWLEWAIALQRRQDERFGDEAGGWFSTSGTDRSVLLRFKEDYDGAEPSPSSISVMNLLALGGLTGDPRWSERVEGAMNAFSGPLTKAPRSVPMMLAALCTFLAPRQEIVLFGPQNAPGAGPGHAGGEETAALRVALASVYLPFSVVVPMSPATRPALVALAPYTDGMTMRAGRATAYVCRDFTCRQPTTDAGQMLKDVR